MQARFDAAIIGGGPAGSTAALLLARSGFEVCLIEKRDFPREMLCGEFLSHEVAAHLEQADLLERFLALSPRRIRTVNFYAGQRMAGGADIPFDAYGLRRGPFDGLLLDAAKESGVTVLQPARAEQILRDPRGFAVHVSQTSGSTTVRASKLIGAYGKQSGMDRQLERKFAAKRTALLGVKFHLPAHALPGVDGSAIHLFAGERGYCGVNGVDGDLLTVCWLTRGGDNPVPPRVRLREMLAATGLTDEHDPELTGAIGTAAWNGAGNIYLGKRDRVAQGVFMVGDASGMIAPLSGDGIGMAIESAALLSGILIRQRAEGLSDARAEALYEEEWAGAFERRRTAAALIQKVLLHRSGRALAARLVRSFPGVLPRFVDFTRGQRPERMRRTYSPARNTRGTPARRATRRV